MSTIRQPGTHRLTPAARAGLEAVATNGVARYSNFTGPTRIYWQTANRLEVLGLVTIDLDHSLVRITDHGRQAIESSKPVRS